MNTKLQRALMSLFKYMFWTGVAAGCVQGADALTKTDLPIWLVPVIAALLKSLATYAATQVEEEKK